MKTLILLAIYLVNSDLNQTGAFSDTTLTTSNVNTSTFGKVSSYHVDVPTFTQPIIAPSIVINGTPRDLLLFTTMTNKVYAFDANSFGLPIWKVTLGTTRSIFPSRGVGNETRWTEIGILGAPAVDTSLNALFVVAALPATYRLFKVSLLDGSIINSTDITGQVTGTGDSGDMVVGGKLQFSAAQHLQRTGLTIANGNVYICFGSLEDTRPWHGWVFAYTESNLSQVGVFCTTPSSFGGGIWQSGGAPSVDGSGNVYVVTGNGNSISDGVELGESILKLSPTLSLLDWFTTSSFSTLDPIDADISSGRAILIPGTSKVTAAGKDFTVYSADTACMGHLQGSNINCTLQTFKSNVAGVVSDTTGSYGSVLVNNKLYVPTTDGSIYGFTVSSGVFSVTPLATQLNTYGFPGTAQISSSNGIIWTVTSTNDSHLNPASGTLRALNASTLTELWNSDQTPGDTLGHMVKYVGPTVYNGKVYVPNQDGQIQVYGLR